MQKVTADNLTRAVEFNCPFRVHEGGLVSREDGCYAPEACYGELIRDGDRSKYAYPFPEDDRWELISGFSGQDSYAGPVMQNSEYLGGAMAEYVLENPGVYVLMAVHWYAEEPEIVYENCDGKCTHPVSFGDNNGECGEPIAVVYPDGSEGGAAEAKRLLKEAEDSEPPEDTIEGWVLARYKEEACTFCGLSDHREHKCAKAYAQEDA